VLLLAAAVVVAAGAVGALLVREGAPRPGATAAIAKSTASAAPGVGAAAGSAGGQSRGPAPSPTASLAPGKLPLPSSADVVVEVTGQALQALPTGSTHLVLNVASLPQPGPSLAVYRYAPRSGPADGSILEQSGLPQGLASTGYPTQAPADAFAAAITREEAGMPSSLLPTLPVTQARLVYVAVVTGGQGYLEPAYLFTGMMRYHVLVQAQVLVPALAPSILQ
jgi:hypothetical protein